MSFLKKPLAIICSLALAFLPVLISVRVTAYAPVRRLTDSTPNITASGKRVSQQHGEKIIALSDDLARQYKFGQRFKLTVEGREYVVEYQDRMAHRWKKTVDLFLPTFEKAKRFGVRSGSLEPLQKSGG